MFCIWDPALQIANTTKKAMQISYLDLDLDSIGIACASHRIIEN